MFLEKHQETLFVFVTKQIKNGSNWLHIRVQELVLGQIPNKNETDPLERVRGSKNNVHAFGTIFAIMLHM